MYDTQEGWIKREEEGPSNFNVVGILVYLRNSRIGWAIFGLPAVIVAVDSHEEHQSTQSYVINHAETRDEVHENPFNDSIVGNFRAEAVVVGGLEIMNYVERDDDVYDQSEHRAAISWRQQYIE